MVGAGPSQRIGQALVAFGVVATLVAACGSEGDEATPASAGETSAATSTPPTTAPARPLPFTRHTLELVDTSRPTDDPHDARDAPSRTLPTEVYVPDGDGPYPLVVLAHGVDGHPRKFTELLSSWAAAGYVVAAPTFPLTNDATGSPSAVQDYPNQPADVSFVIDELLRRSAAGEAPVAGKVDPDRVGMSGLSLGGGTAYGVTFHPCCRDDRIDATIVMDSLRFPFDGGDYDLSGAPLLVFHGTADPLLPMQHALDAYAAAAGPKYLVTLEGGTHAPPFEDTDSPHDEVVEAVTLDFWDAYLGGDPEAVDRLLTDAAVAGLAHVDAETAGQPTS